jgi:class 3 adenylate cyclase
MEYRVLGPLEVLDASGRKLPLGGAMQQSVLAALLLHRGQTVALERLIDDLWDEPPETAARTVQAYVSRLRHELPNGTIESRPGGYRLVLDGGDLGDVETFERRAEEGRRALAAGEGEEAGRLLRSALALWRGSALAGLTSEALRRQAERLEELRLSAIEDRLEADLRCARDAEIVPELKTLVAEHPFRERLRAQLMRALYRSGRPREALELYRETRRQLVDELGMEPGQELRELEQAILRQDAELEAPGLRRSTAPAAPVPLEPERQIEQPVPREVRKTVTILFCDIVDSTGRGESTDPEVVRSRLARFFDQMKKLIEHHGGTVEKFIGDAVMAVFGVPMAHEDDALRACRAAIEMRGAMPALGVEGRIGLTTGEVVTGTEERLATGDAVNVAARLEQAASPGEVLIGKPTLELAREALEVEPLEPLELKGKAQPVEAYRLKTVRESVSRPAETPFVGREQELSTINATWERVFAERRCELFTIVGEAGVGKSRLVAEALASVDSRVVQGRCLPYGEGITYWPVIGVIKQLDALPSDPAAAVAIRSFLGDSSTEIASAEEIAWALRKLLEEQAPLVVVFDDIQWGEDVFLDLLEHVALLAARCQILLLAMARPELADHRPTWPISLRLEPLPNEAVEELIGPRVAAEVRERIAAAAGGNPLFVSEMLAMAEEAPGEVAVPPTLQALIAARLDQLDAAERVVLERGAVQGEVFHRGAVQALTPEETQVTPHLAALIRKGLIRTDAPQLAGEDGFRFRHLLIRDAAYERLAKATRADLHERFATWLAERVGNLVEPTEILGFHLEQAAGYKAELGQTDPELATRATGYLATAGRRALWRGDKRAAAPLLERALNLTRPLKLDIHLELDLADAQPSPRAQAAIAEAAIGPAREAGDNVGEALARVVTAEARLDFSDDAAASDLERLARAALPILEKAADNAGMARVWCALTEVANFRARFEEWAEAAEQALRQFQLAGQQHFGITGLAGALVFGPRPAGEGLQTLDSVLPTNPSPATLILRAQLLAMLGRFTEAWAIALPAGERFREFTGDADGQDDLAAIAALAGDHGTAARHLRAACDMLERRGSRALLSTCAPRLGISLCALGRHHEAEKFAKVGRDLGGEHDFVTQVLWRQVQARVHAHRDEHAPAEQLAKEAVAFAERTDGLNLQGDALCDLAEILAGGGRNAVAAERLEEALVRYERKENLVMVERVRERLAELRMSLASTERA